MDALIAELLIYFAYLMVPSGSHGLRMPEMQSIDAEATDQPIAVEL